jgi:hypothetical protein
VAIGIAYLHGHHHHHQQQQQQGHTPVITILLPNSGCGYVCRNGVNTLQKPPVEI